MLPHTAASVAALIERNMEPTTAEDVLAALKQVNGQPITPRLLDHLPGGRVEWRLSKQLGTTELKNRAYMRDAREGVCLVLAKSDEVSAAFVELANPTYFRLRRERNALRALALDPANVPLLERAASLCNEFALARQQLAALVRDGEPLSPDRIDIERACGLRED